MYVLVSISVSFKSGNESELFMIKHIVSLTESSDSLNESDERNHSIHEVNF